MLLPLYDKVRVETFEGKYSVQLEVPFDSTLTSDEIARIVLLSSWSVDPSRATQLEGLRSVILERAVPVMKRGIALGGLQLSGIGSLPVESDADALGRVREGGLRPPTRANFMAGLAPGVMTTHSVKEGRLIASRPAYRARGTYLLPELKAKIEGTRKVTKLRLEKLATPHVEAWGRYVDAELGTEDGQFGFLVTTVPGGGLRRFGEQLQVDVTGGTRPLAPAEVMDVLASATERTAKLSRGLRELHDRGYAHLQVHASNFYIVPPGDEPYLVDWGTLDELSGTAEDRCLARGSDLCKPIDSLLKLVIKRGPAKREDARTYVWQTAIPKLLRDYCGASRRDVAKSHSRTSNSDLRFAVACALRRLGVEQGEGEDSSYHGMKTGDRTLKGECDVRSGTLRATFEPGGTPS